MKAIQTYTSPRSPPLLSDSGLTLLLDMTILPISSKEARLSPISSQASHRYDQVAVCNPLSLQRYSAQLSTPSARKRSTLAEVTLKWTKATSRRVLTLLRRVSPPNEAPTWIVTWKPLRLHILCNGLSFPQAHPLGQYKHHIGL